MAEPASIRYKNPGAMWGGNAVSRRWGELGNVSLKDGTGQGNKIAVFPSHLNGIAAQLDLWRSSKYYKNKPFKEGIATWAGNNSVPSYIALVKDRVPGMTGNTIMNDEFWRSSKAIPFLKAQAFHEAGKPYPAPDAAWVEARKLVFAKDGVITKPVVVGSGTSGGSLGAGVGLEQMDSADKVGELISTSQATAESIAYFSNIGKFFFIALSIAALVWAGYTLYRQYKRKEEANNVLG